MQTVGNNKKTLQHMHEDRYKHSSAGGCGTRDPVSLSLFLEINNLEIEHQLVCAATFFWAQAIWTEEYEEKCDKRGKDRYRKRKSVSRC